MKTYVEMESKSLDESNTTKLSSQDSHKILSKRKIMGLRYYEFRLQFNLIGCILELIFHKTSITKEKK